MSRIGLAVLVASLVIATAASVVFCSLEFAGSPLHPMHIHQVHFLGYAENDKLIADPLWLDTVNVPYGGTVDVSMEFTTR